MVINDNNVFLLPTTGENVVRLSINNIDKAHVSLPRDATGRRDRPYVYRRGDYTVDLSVRVEGGRAIVTEGASGVGRPWDKEKLGVSPNARREIVREIQDAVDRWYATPDARRAFALAGRRAADNRVKGAEAAVEEAQKALRDAHAALQNETIKRTRIYADTLAVLGADAGTRRANPGDGPGIHRAGGAIVRGE